MTKREIGLVGFLVAAAVLLVIGVAMLTTPGWAFVAAAAVTAALGVVFFAEVG